MQENISDKRFGGCTLGGAVSVSSFIPDTVTVIHAPQGCAHQVFSMLHALMVDSGTAAVPNVIVSNISDKEVIFGGEEMLAKALDRAAAKNPKLIVVLSSCAPATIGDDCAFVCANHKACDKIIFVNTAGFIGGSSRDGEIAMLKGIADMVPVADIIPKSVVLVGEKNLETEVEESYAEVVRLLSLLGLFVSVRFCRNEPVEKLCQAGTGACFIARDARVFPAAEYLAKKCGRPVVSEFPHGLSASISFLEKVGRACSVSEEKIAAAVILERAYQKKALGAFAKLAGKRIYLGGEPFAGTLAVAREALDYLGSEPLAGTVAVAREALDYIGAVEALDGVRVKIPFFLPVGTAGIVKMLNLWKREVLYG